MKASLVVVNYQTMDLAERLLEAASGPEVETIVVDNASFGGDRAPVEGRHPSTRFVWSGYNGGYGAGANLGAALASGEVIVVANADVSIPYPSLLELADQAAGVGLAAPRFVDPGGELIRSSHRRDPFLLSTLREYCAPLAATALRLRPEWHPTLRPAREHDRDHDTLHVLGALMAVDATAFRAVGGFDESFFLYREETDLCRRLRAAWWRVRHVGSVTAIHGGDASAPAGALPVAVRQAAVRSHYHYIAKHYGRPSAGLAYLLGVLGSLLWAAAGPRRSIGLVALRSHLAILRR